jgi:branched-subunit amino acid transport protein
MMSSFWVIVACIGLALITLITRAFFMIPERELPLPTGSSAGSNTRRWRPWRR